LSTTDVVALEQVVSSVFGVGWVGQFVMAEAKALGVRIKRVGLTKSLRSFGELRKKVGEQLQVAKGAIAWRWRWHHVE
jgi:hypothetical protein